MRTMNRSVAIATISSLITASCVSVHTPILDPPEAAAMAAQAAPPGATLSVHLRSGHLIQLEKFSSEGDTLLRGEGVRYDESRQKIGSGTMEIPIDSIALLATETKTTAYPAGLAITAVYTTLMATLTAVCVADPKACFGSCPTFYLDDSSTRPVAEGFSGSIARSLEATDVDRLPTRGAAGKTFSLVMRNEALETHAVRSVRVLAVPQGDAADVLAATDGKFYPIDQTVQPLGCRSDAGDCLSPVTAFDSLERWIPTDSTDLGRLETVELEFPPMAGSVGLILGLRQSLVSTYLLYQVMGFAGRKGEEWLAAVERFGRAGVGRAFEAWDRLESIEVTMMAADGSWQKVGTVGEPGPLAPDVQLLPLGPNNDSLPIRIRLSLAQGAWRLGYAALGRVGSPVTPIPLEVNKVEREGHPDTAALSRLRSGGRYLITNPGDKYRLEWTIPPNDGPVRLFLESTGYYYEWMRQECLRDENPVMLLLLATDPLEALRRMAPRFKAREDRMEQLFWGSRFSRQR